MQNSLSTSSSTITQVYKKCNKCQSIFHFIFILYHKTLKNLCPHCIHQMRQQSKGKVNLTPKILTLYLDQKQQYYIEIINSTFSLFKRIIKSKGVQFQPSSSKFQVSRANQECIQCGMNAICIKLDVCGHTYCNICSKQKTIKPVGSPSVQEYLVDCTACQQQRKLQDKLQYYHSSFVYENQDALCNDNLSDVQQEDLKINQLHISMLKREQNLTVSQACQKYYSQQNPKCPVCEKQFGLDLERNWPHPVPCTIYGHMICTSCFMVKLQEWVNVWVQIHQNKSGGGRPKFLCPICKEICKSIRYVSRNPKELMDKFVRLRRKHLVPLKRDMIPYKRKVTKNKSESGRSQLQDSEQNKKADRFQKSKTIFQQDQRKGAEDQKFQPKPSKNNKYNKSKTQQAKKDKLDSLKHQKDSNVQEDNQRKDRDSEKQQIIKLLEVDDKTIQIPFDRSFVVLNCYKKNHLGARDQILDLLQNKVIDMVKFKNEFKPKCKVCKSSKLKPIKVLVQNAIVELSCSEYGKSQLKDSKDQYRHTYTNKQYKIFNLVDYQVFKIKIQPSE